jgi:hypothetical protein
MSENCGETKGDTNDVTTWRIRVHTRYAKLHTHAHAPEYPHARAHTHTHTHRPISNTCCFSTATMIRKSASLLRYTYIACLVSHTFNYFHSGMSISTVGPLTFGRPEWLIYNFFLMPWIPCIFVQLHLDPTKCIWLDLNVIEFIISFLYLDSLSFIFVLCQYFWFLCSLSLSVFYSSESR